MRITKKSRWAYDGSTGVDIGVLLGSFQKGDIDLTDSLSHQRLRLYYTAAGAGIDLGPPISLTWSTSEMEPDTGDVYVSDNVGGRDLSSPDFDGLCFIHGVSGHFGVGGNHSMVFFGIPPSKVPKQIIKGQLSSVLDWKSYLLGPLYQAYKAGALALGSSADMPNVIKALVGEAKGVIVSKGMIVDAMIPGVGGSATIGYLSHAARPEPFGIELSSGEDIPVVHKVVSADKTIVMLPADVLFGFDKDQLGTGQGGLRAAERALGAVASIISMFEPRFVSVEGHADATGSRQYNKGLSERRARAAHTWLSSKGKLKTTRISFVGFGEDKPVYSNSTIEGRSFNRRVEFSMLD